MGLASWLGSKIAPTSRASMDQAQAAAAAMLDPNSAFYKSGDLGLNTAGSAGNAILAQAAKVGADNVSANFTPMDQDAAALGNLGAQYQQQFEQGGLAEKAATGRATSSMADAGGGGQEGVLNLRQGSQVLSKQAEATGNAERTSAGTAANENSYLSGMMAVRKAAFQAALTHANYQKNLDSQQIGLDLQNTQTANDQRLRAAGISAQSTLQGIGQGVKNQQTNLGFQMINAGLQAGAGAAAIGTDYSKITPVSTSVSPAALDIARTAAYNRQGLEAPKSAVDVYKDSAHEQLLANQALLNSLTGSTVTYPGMPADTTSYVNNASAYPIAASLNR